MAYNKKLPTLEEIQKMSAHIEHYPVAVDDVIRLARLHGYSDNAVDFLELFNLGGGNKFTSLSDYFARTSELLMLICEEENQPAELVVSV